MIRIPDNTTIIGELRSSGEIRIDGHFQGKGFVDGTLILTETSVWIGNAIADTIVIEGVFEGDIIARKKLVVGPQANIQGNIKAPAIKITYGAKLCGNINMNKSQAIAGLLEHKSENNKQTENEFMQLTDEKRA